MTPEEFERHRRKTIELLHPAEIAEMKACARALDMSFDEFMYHLDQAAEYEDYYHSMGDNESYRDYDWDKIWAGFELLTGKKRPSDPQWGPRHAIFSCAC